MNFGDGYDYEEADRAYKAGMDDGGELGYNIGYHEGYQDGMRSTVDTTEPGFEWVRTADRLPEGDEHDEVLSLYKGTDYLLYDIVQVGWLRLHPEMYVYWTRMPQKPEVEG